MKDYLLNTLFKPVSASTISTFRIFFGSVLFLEMLYFWRIGFVPFGLTKPVFHLKYDYFEWVEPASEIAMNSILTLMTISAICIAVGFLYRIATAIFLGGFTYFMLIEQSHYNNHFYLFILLLFIMLFIDADKMYSIKSWRKKTDTKEVPAWHHRILTFLLFITYFFGGIAKLSSEWLSGRLPLALVNNLPNSNGMKSALGADTFATFLQYGGILFDLSIGFLLLYKKTRWFAVIGVIIFNYTNGVILFDDIGHFPFFMVLSTILFFESDFIEKLFNTKEENTNSKRKKKKQEKAPIISNVQSIEWTSKRLITASLIGLFVLIQLILPLRHHFHSGNPEWDGVHSRFSWRMKMQSKNPSKVELKFKDLTTQEEVVLPITQHLTGHQKSHISQDPYYLVQLAKYFKYEAIQNRDMTNVVVRGNVELSFNGREEQQYINPQIDLAEIDPRKNNTEWIIPLKALK